MEAQNGVVIAGFCNTSMRSVGYGSGSASKWKIESGSALKLYGSASLHGRKGSIFWLSKEYQRGKKNRTRRLCPSYFRGCGGQIRAISSTFTHTQQHSHFSSFFQLAHTLTFWGRLAFVYTTFTVTREYWRIHRVPGFLAVVWFGSFQIPSPLSREQVFSLSQSSCVSPVELSDTRRGGGGGEGAI